VDLQIPQWPDQAVQVSPSGPLRRAAANAYENLKGKDLQTSSCPRKRRRPAAAEAQGTREVGGTVLMNITDHLRLHSKEEINMALPNKTKG